MQLNCTEKSFDQLLGPPAGKSDENSIDILGELLGFLLDSEFVYMVQLSGLHVLLNAKGVSELNLEYLDFVSELPDPFNSVDFGFAEDIVADEPVDGRVSELQELDMISLQAVHDLA